MEVMVLLKLEVDVEQARQPGETDDDVRTKTRAFIGDVVAHVAANQANAKLIKLVGSALTSEVSDTWTVQVELSDSVL